MRASHYTELRDKVQNRWNGDEFVLGTLPQWSSNLTPAGPAPGPATPVFGSDLVDLRACLKLYKSASNRPITAWANPAGQVVVVNRHGPAAARSQGSHLPVSGSGRDPVHPAHRPARPPFATGESAVLHSCCLTAAD